MNSVDPNRSLRFGPVLAWMTRGRIYHGEETVTAYRVLNTEGEWVANIVKPWKMWTFRIFGNESAQPFYDSKEEALIGLSNSFPRTS